MTEPRKASPTETARPRWQRLFLVAFIAVTLGVSGISLYTNLTRQAARDAANAAPGQFETLEIVTAGGVRPFRVEVMRTDAERAKGLMFRQSMPADQGMLFDFKLDSPVSMWMKNTYIPLDMLFVTADGTVSRIERMTEPHSEKTIPSGGPVRAVLELNGGAADKAGIKPGDRLRHPMFPAR